MAGEKRLITRNRTSYSCRNCRLRKIKCGKERPTCSACTKTADVCIYGAGNESQPSEERTISTSPVPRKRKQNSDSTVHTDEEHSSTDPTLRLHQCITELSNLLEQLTATAQSTESHIQRSNGHLDGDSRIGRSENHSPIDQLQPVSQVNRDTQFNGKSRNVAYNDNGQHLHNNENTREPGSVKADDLSAISRQLIQLQELLQSKSASHSATEPGHRSKHERVSASHTNQTNEDDNSSFSGTDIQYVMIPNQEQHNVLFRNWLTSIYPILPIVDASEILSKYEKFHQWHRDDFDRGLPNPMMDYMPLIHAIHYGGALGTSLRAFPRWWPGPSRRVLLSVIQKQYHQSMCSISHHTPCTVAAMIMMYYMDNNTTSDYDSSDKLISIIRAAQICGLHRQSPGRVSLIEGELRHRLWWETVNLDSALSASRNSPPFLHREFFNAPMPTEMKLHRIGQQNAQEYEQLVRDGSLQPDHADDPEDDRFTSMVSVHGMILRARTVVSDAMRKMFEIYLAARPLTKKDMIDLRQSLSTTENTIKSIIARIPSVGAPEYDFGPKSLGEGQSIAVDYGSSYGQPVTQYEIEQIIGLSIGSAESIADRMPFIFQMRIASVVFHRWARIVLSMLVDQIHCLSYAPFLRDSKSKLWELARQCALKHSHSYLRKYNTLAIDPKLERFRWTWTSMFQPMHASMLLLMDLYDRPFSAEAPRSRALFDQMLSLSDPKHGIVHGEDGLGGTPPLVEGGLEASALFEKLRAKAWQRAALNPNLLWNEEDQISVGSAKSPSELDKLVQSIREDAIFNSQTSETIDLSCKVGPVLRKAASISKNELRHPSEAGPPPAIENHQSYAFATVNHANLEPRQVILQARDDQQRIASYDKQGWHQIPTSIFSVLMDMNSLIRKIKEAKQSNSDKPEAHRSSNSEITPSRSVANSWISDPSATINSQNMNGCHFSDQEQMIGVALKEINDTRVDHDFDRSHLPLSFSTNHGNSMSSTEPVVQVATFTTQNRNFTGIDTNGEHQPINFDFEFDWEHWDSVFGQVEDGSLGDIMDMDTIAYAFSG